MSQRWLRAHSAFLMVVINVGLGIQVGELFGQSGRPNYPLNHAYLQNGQAPSYAPQPRANLQPENSLRYPGLAPTAPTRAIRQAPNYPAPNTMARSPAAPIRQFRASAASQ